MSNHGTDRLQYSMDGVDIVSWNVQSNNKILCPMLMANYGSGGQYSYFGFHNSFSDCKVSYAPN